MQADFFGHSDEGFILESLVARSVLVCSNKQDHLYGFSGVAMLQHSSSVEDLTEELIGKKQIDYYQLAFMAGCVLESTEQGC